MYSAIIWSAAITVGSLLVAIVSWILLPLRADWKTSNNPPRIVRFTRVIAIIWAAGCVIGGSYAVVVALAAPDVPITISVATYWPKLPDTVVMEGPTAALASGGFTSAQVVVTGLDFTTRILHAVSQALWALIPASIAVLVAVACTLLIRGKAFTSALVRMCVIAAVTVALGGIFAQATGDIASMAAAEQLLRWHSAHHPTTPGFENLLEALWPQPGIKLDIPFWPIVAGLALSALATIVKSGTRLQRDTEGLV